MIKFGIFFSVRTSLSCLRFFSMVIAAYVCTVACKQTVTHFSDSFRKYVLKMTFPKNCSKIMWVNQPQIGKSMTIMPHTAKFGINQFLLWKHCHIKFIALWWFKIISGALIMFPWRFERADKFIPFPPYHILAFMIFLNCDGTFHFGLPLLNQHGDPQFFCLFSNSMPI